MSRFLCWLLGHRWDEWQAETLEDERSVIYGYSRTCRRCVGYQWIPRSEYARRAKGGR